MYRELTYRSSVGEGAFMDILPKKLTFQMNKKVWRGDQSSTIFKELTPVVNPAPQGWESWCIDDPNHSKLIYDKLLETVARMWDDSKTQVISHSSGYDSRVLSMIIRDLGKEAIFVEVGGEVEKFKAVMKYFGWKNYVCHSPIQELDLKKTLNNFKAPVGYPFSYLYQPYEELKKQGKIPEDCVIFFGQGQNEVTKRLWRYKSIENYWRFTENLALNNFKISGDFRMPFLDEEFIRFRARYKTSLEMTYDMLPEPLKSMPKDTIVKETRVVKNMFEVITEFTRSWLGRRVSVSPTSSIDYSEWWAYWVAASFIEEIRHDHEIIF